MPRTKQVGPSVPVSSGWRRWAGRRTAPHPIVLVALFLLLAAGVVLWARGLSPSRQSALTGTAPAAATSRPPAPDFTVTTADGGSFSMAAHQNRVRVLFFTGEG